MLLFTLLVVFNSIFYFTHQRESQETPTSQRGPTGEVVAVVNIAGFSFTNCTKTLPIGYNLFSGYCLGTETDVHEALGNLTELEWVMSYVKEDTNDPWESYNPSLPSWVVQDLNVLNRNKGYWFKMRANGTFWHSGIIKQENTISMKTGWNLIGYPSILVQDTGTTFQGMNGKYSQVVGFNDTNQTYEYYFPGGDNNTLNYTSPFQGYWVYATQDGSVTIYGE